MRAARLIRGGLLLAVLSQMVPGPALAQAPERVHFANWEFSSNPLLVEQARTAEQLVLRLNLPMPDGGPPATLTLLAGRAGRGDLRVALAAEWTQRSRGLNLHDQPREEELELGQGIKGLSRTQGLADGGFLMVDAYRVPGGISALVVEARGALAAGVMGGAAAMLRMSAALHPVGTTSSSAAVPSPSFESLLADIPGPADPGADPGEDLDLSPRDRLRTLSDFQEIEVGPTLHAFLRANAGLLGSARPRPASRESALETARQLLGGERAAGALQALRAHPDLQSPDVLQGVAVAALAAGRPLDALACLTLAAERWGEHPSVLFTLAGLLAQHGAASEAEALLDVLERFGLAPEHPFGITPRQGMDYLKAYIHARQGRYQEAVLLLRPLVAENPAFAEPGLLLALLEARFGRGARKILVSALFRRPPRAIDQGPGESERDSGEDPDQEPSGDLDGVETVRLRGEEMVDLAKGTPGKLPPIFQPTDTGDAIRFQQWAMDVEPTLRSQTASMDQARFQAAEASRVQPRDELERDHLQALESLFSEANVPLPAMRKLLRHKDRAIEDLTEAQGRITERFLSRYLEIMRRHEFDQAKACGEIASLAEACHGSLRVHTQAVDLTTRRTHRTWHRWATALAGSTSDRHFREYLARHIALANHVEYSVLILNMAKSVSYAYYVASCREAERRAAEEALRDIEASRLPECTDDMAKVSVGVEASTSVPVKGKPLDASLGIEVTCRGLSVEASVMLLDTLGISLEGEFGLDGEHALYLGPKGKLGSDALGAEASHKEGVFVTMDRNSFRDAGWRSQSKTTRSAGEGVKVTASSTLQDHKASFFPAPSVPTRSAYSLRTFASGG